MLNISDVRVKLERTTLSLVIKLRSVTKHIRPWGFFGLSLWEVGYQFYKCMIKGAISMRASAIAFKFFLAIFPTIIFFFTLIPYVPIEQFQEKLIQFIGSILPESGFSVIETTIRDIATNKRLSLLSFGVLGSLYFSTNGLVAMITAFNETINTFERRAWYEVRAVSAVLVITIFVFASVAIALITSSETVLNYLVVNQILKVGITYYMLVVGKWIITISFFYFTIALVYYMAPAKRSKFMFFSPGATLATILGIILIVGFSYYINNFSQYNSIYGSIGTLIIVLMWFQLNSLVMLIGFELNASIGSLKQISETEK